MRFQIHHETIYHYTGLVFPEPHTVRLRPASNSDQTLHRFDLRIEPEPAGVTAVVDSGDNDANIAWFNGQTETLRIVIDSVVETHRANPFDFLLMPGAERAPFTYPPATERALRTFMDERGGDEDDGDDEDGDGPLRQLGAEVLRAANHDTIAFLTSLNQRLHEMITVDIRETGTPFSPLHTLETGHGACRDIAVLFMAVCRRMGLASRFVSGYRFGGDEPDGHELHAWAQVFLPGGGWRAFDPTAGLAVGDEHVTLAAAADPLLAAPVSGNFRGTGVTAKMEAKLSIEEVK